MPNTKFDHLDSLSARGSPKERARAKPQTKQNMPDLEKERKFRLQEDDNIEKAWKKLDCAAIKKMCTATLMDPKLPLFFRAKYEVMLASLPFSSWESHTENAFMALDDLKAHIGQEPKSSTADIIKQIDELENVIFTVCKHQGEAEEHRAGFI